MKICMRYLAILTAAGCVLSACGSSGGEGEGSGGTNGSGGSTGSGGTASGGATGSGGQGTGGTAPGSGGHASGGSGSGGSASGGSASGGKGSGGTTASGGNGSGGAASGGVTGSGGQGMAGSGTGATGGHGTGGLGGGSTASGGATGMAGSNGSGGSSGGAGTSGMYNPCPTNGDPCRILPVGDSITFGINYEGSYRPELFHKALMAGQKITYTGTLMNGPATVDNMPFPMRYEATSGITISGISMQITKNKTLNMPADIVLIHIGTNDMYMTPTGAPDRLASLIEQIATGLPNALIAVAQIIPLKSSAPAVMTFNAAIPGVVAKEVTAGRHVIMVDLFDGFPAADISMDNVHPVQAGYNWMGDKWYDAVGSLFPK